MTAGTTVSEASGATGYASRILLVDDNALMRVLVRGTLELSGAFTVVGEADDGIAGVEEAGRCRPDAVVLDLAMPGQDGLETLPLLRRICPDAVIVIFSGFPAAQMEATVLTAGADGYVEKGVGTTALPETLRRLLNARAAAHRARSSTAPAPRVAGSALDLDATQGPTIATLDTVAVLERRVAERTAELQRENLERRAAEARLARAQASRLREYEASPTPIVVLRDGAFAYLNPAAARLLAVDVVADVLGRPAGDHVPLDGRPTEDALRVAYRLDGSDVLVRAVTVPVEFDGRPAQLVMLRDVSAEEAAAEALRSSERRFLDFIENSGAACFAKDLDGRFLLGNSVAAAALGTTSEALLGRRDDDFMPADEAAQLRRHDADVLVSGGAHTVEEQVDGRTYVSVKFPLRSATGAVYGIGGVATDVSELRRTQEQLASATRALEAQNAELRQANEDLSAFAFIAAHDLKSPLAVVKGFSELVRRTAGPRLEPREIEYLDAAVQGAVQMTRLVNDLLAYSRAGTARPALQTLPLAEPVRQAMANLAVEIDATGAVLEVDALPLVLGDAGQLTQLLQNLLGNAMKFVAPGVQPRVRVAAAVAGGRCRLTVTDNGVGLPEEQRGRAFGMFQRLHAEDGYDGTGIGLAIVKRIAEHHQGSVECAPAPGGGTVFTVDLPAA